MTFIELLQIILLLLATAGVIALVLAVIKLDRRLSNLEKPKYGFLGKPLLLFAVFSFGSLSLSSIAINNQLSTRTTDVSVSDTKTEVVYAKINILYDNTSDTIALIGLPVIDGVEWGDKKVADVDLEWSIYEDGILKKFEVRDVTFDSLQPLALQGISKKRDVKLTMVYSDYIYFAFLRLN